MRLLFYTLVLLILSVGVNGQGGFNKTNNSPKGFSKALDDADISVNLGTQVGTSFNNSYWFTQNVSPNIKFNVTEKFSLVFGVGASLSQLYNIPMYTYETEPLLANGSTTSVYTYIAGIYQVNQKLQLNSMLFLENSSYKMDLNPNTIQNNYKDVSLGVNYKVSRHVTINAQMQFSDRPYYNNYGRQTQFGFGTPYGNFSPFY